jgi:hypothetical protein
VSESSLSTRCPCFVLTKPILTIRVYDVSGRKRVPQLIVPRDELVVHPDVVGGRGGRVDVHKLWEEAEVAGELLQEVVAAAVQHVGGKVYWKEEKIEVHDELNEEEQYLI